MSVPNFSSLARLEVPEKFLWGVGGGVVCTVIFMSNPTVVLCCVEVGVLTIKICLCCLKACLYQFLKPVSAACLKRLVKPIRPSLYEMSPYEIISYGD